MRNDFTVRISVQSDTDRLKEIIDLSFPRFFRFFASHALDSEGKVLVGEAKNSVVGFAKLTEFKVGVDRFGCVLWLAVHPDFRRQNVGAELVEAGTDYLFSRHAGAVFASIQRRNSASLATFRKAGFRNMGFLGLRRIFRWRVFSFYGKIWFAPGEVVFMNGFAENCDLTCRHPNPH